MTSQRPLPASRYLIDLHEARTRYVGRNGFVKGTEDIGSGLTFGLGLVRIGRGMGRGIGAGAAAPAPGAGAGGVVDAGGIGVVVGSGAKYY